jgi:hypothetical protein
MPRRFVPAASGVGAVSHRGVFYFPVMNTVEKANISGVNSANFAPITPTETGTKDREDYGHGRPVVMFSGPGFPYVAFDDAEGVYPELNFYNDIGWHTAYRGTSGATMYAAGYSRLTGWLIINDGATRRKRLRNTSNAEYPDYALTGSAETAWYDAGLPAMSKAFRDITLNVRDVNADTNVAVYYKVDDEDAAWVLIGTITNAGVNTLTLRSLQAQVAAKRLKFKFSLTRITGDVTKTPVIEMPIVGTVLPTPEASHAFSDTLIVAEAFPLRDPYPYEVGNVYTITEMKEFIDELEDTTETITRFDEFGTFRLVKNTDFARQDSLRMGNDPSRETPVISLTFLEVFSGWQRQVDAQVTFTVVIETELVDAISTYGSAAYGAATYGG